MHRLPVTLIINILSVPEVDYINQHYIIKYLVDNPVITNPYPVTISAFKLFVTRWTRVAGQLPNWFRGLIGEFIKLLLRSFG